MNNSIPMISDDKVAPTTRILYQLNGEYVTMLIIDNGVITSSHQYVSEKIYKTLLDEKCKLEKQLETLQLQALENQKLRQTLEDKITELNKVIEKQSEQITRQSSKITELSKQNTQLSEIVHDLQIWKERTECDQYYKKLGMVLCDINRVYHMEKEKLGINKELSRLRQFERHYIVDNDEIEVCDSRVLEALERLQTIPPKVKSKFDQTYSSNFINKVFEFLVSKKSSLVVTPQDQEDAKNWF
jgi:chromosome segregation ATPase